MRREESVTEGRVTARRRRRRKPPRETHKAPSLLQNVFTYVSREFQSFATAVSGSSFEELGEEVRILHANVA